MIDAAKAVGHDRDHGQAETDGKVGEVFGVGDGDQPTAGAFNEKGGVFGREFVEPLDEWIEREGPVFELRGDERGGRSLEPDGIGFVERERVVRGGTKDFDIGAFPAAKRLECDGS